MSRLFLLGTLDTADQNRYYRWFELLGQTLFPAGVPPRQAAREEISNQNTVATWRPRPTPSTT